MNEPTVPSPSELLVKEFEAKYKEDPIRYSSLPGVTTNWPPRKMVALYGMVHRDTKPTQDEIAEEFKVDRSTISRKDNGMDWEDFAKKLHALSSCTREEYVQSQAESTQEKELLRHNKKANIQDLRQAAYQKNFYERIEQVASPLPAPRLPPFHISRKPKGTPEHAVLLLSDMHAGQQFSLNETGGLNEYNVDVFVQRAKNLRQAVCDIYDLHSKLYNIPVLHVLALGDMVQGTNLGGEWGCANNGPVDVFQQAELVATTTGEMLSEWSKIFQQINFVGVVGNHGRAGISKNSDKIGANWDNTAYALIKSRLHSHPNISVSYGESWWREIDVNGTEVMLVHGDYISGNLNSLIAQEQKFQSMVAGTTGKPFDVLCLGHFHAHYEIETARGKILVNGGFVGGDMHSMAHMRAISSPSQTFFGVHPEHSITWKYCLDLETKRATPKAMTAREKFNSLRKEGQ